MEQAGNHFPIWQHANVGHALPLSDAGYGTAECAYYSDSTPT
jgi:hypothetical protein